MKPEQARALNDQAVKHLVRAHARLDEPLLLAIRFKLNEPGIHLLEVLETFPGEDDDPPLETEFSASPDVRMVGALKLAVASPAQFRTLAGADSELCRALKAGRIEFVAGYGAELARLLNLQNLASESEMAARLRLLKGTPPLTDSDREELKKAWG